LLLAPCFAWPMAPSLESCWILLCCAGWSGLVFWALDALCCFVVAWLLHFGHGFAAGALFLAALLTAALPLQVFAPGDIVTCFQDIGWLIWALVAL
jgi:hypothetical protein